MSNKKRPAGPQDVPLLLPQPVQGDTPDAAQLVNRYGTYEIQPTADSSNLFPTIAQGAYNKAALHQLRAQSRIQTDPEAKHDLTEDKKNG